MKGLEILGTPEERAARIASNVAAYDKAVRTTTIEVSTRQYESNHGAKPRGRGTWGFMFDPSTPFPLDAEVWWAGFGTPAGCSLTYGEAVKLAKAEARSRGASLIVVCS